MNREKVLEIVKKFRNGEQFFDKNCRRYNYDYTDNAIKKMLNVNLKESDIDELFKYNEDKPTYFKTFKIKSKFIFMIIFWGMLMGLFTLSTGVQVSDAFWVGGIIFSTLLILFLTAFSLYIGLETKYSNDENFNRKSKSCFIKLHNQYKDIYNYFTNNNFENFEHLINFHKSTFRHINYNENEIIKIYTKDIKLNFFSNLEEYENDSNIFDYDFNKIEIPKYSEFNIPIKHSFDEETYNEIYTINSAENNTKRILDIAEMIGYDKKDKIKKEFNAIFSELRIQEEKHKSKSIKNQDLENKLKALSKRPQTKEVLEEIEKTAQKLLNKKTIENT